MKKGFSGNKEQPKRVDSSSILCFALVLSAHTFFFCFPVLMPISLPIGSNITRKLKKKEKYVDGLLEGGRQTQLTRETRRFSSETKEKLC